MKLWRNLGVHYSAICYKGDTVMNYNLFIFSVDYFFGIVSIYNSCFLNLVESLINILYFTPLMNTKQVIFYFILWYVWCLKILLWSGNSLIIPVGFSNKQTIRNPLGIR